MHPTPTQAVNAFMERHWDKHSRLLLAFSGGPDSLALLHLLLEYFRQQHVAPHTCLALAHVDHGWREESRQESAQLSRMAADLGLTFHQKALEPMQSVGNLEEACREERLLFFADLCRRHAYRAVLFGQHGGDQAETVLKRIFEGASLYNLGGIRPITEMHGMILWRPLLQVSKRQLEQWLSMRGLHGLDDYTNRDPRFLRARLRTQLLPELSRMFGKEVSANLAHLGSEAAELHAYLAARMAPVVSKVQCGPFGSWLDFNEEASLLPLEIKYAVRACCEREHVFLSRSHLQCAAELLSARSANKCLTAGERLVHIDRGGLFVLSQSIPASPLDTSPLEEGTHSFGCWTVRVTPMASTAAHAVATNWRHVWLGKGEVVLPLGHYRVGMPPGTSAMAKWWSNAKVPAFLRNSVPVLYRDDVPVHEFLTGRCTCACAGGPGLKIELLR